MCVCVCVIWLYIYVWWYLSRWSYLILIHQCYSLAVLNFELHTGVLSFSLSLSCNHWYLQVHLSPSSFLLTLNLNSNSHFDRLFYSSSSSSYNYKLIRETVGRAWQTSTIYITLMSFQQQHVRLPSPLLSSHLISWSHRHSNTRTTLIDFILFFLEWVS